MRQSDSAHVPPKRGDWSLRMIGRALLLVALLFPAAAAAQTACPEQTPQRVIFNGWAQCTDAEDGDLTLASAAMEWTSSGQGHVAHGDAAHPDAVPANNDGYGCLRQGSHTFTLRCEDSDGGNITETDFGVGGITVLVDLANAPPVILITPYGVQNPTPQPGDCLGDDCP